MKNLRILALFGAGFVLALAPSACTVAKTPRTVEEKARELGMRKMVVMSALGTKGYYARLGYEKQGAYVSKPL